MNINSPKPKVGIDLAGAEAGATAPGTARLVSEQTRALFALDLGWDWAPVVGSRNSPLWDLVASRNPAIVPGRRVSTRALLQVGPAWRRLDCVAAFAPSGLLPFSTLPVIANFFDSSIYEHGQTWIDSGKRRGYYLIRFLGWHAMRKARKLLILSDYGRRKMIEFFPKTEAKWVVNPCGLSELPPPSETPPAWAATLTKPFFVSVGVFSENKNQRRLIEAWSGLQKRFPDFPALVLIGPGDDYFLTSAIAPARSASPRPHEIIITGRVADADLAWAFTNAYACIQPSIAEGFNLCVIEAMKYRLPVTCSNTTALPETVGDAALLFSPFDPAGIAIAAEQIWTEAALRKTLVERGDLRHPRFTWEASARGVAVEMEKLLREIKR